LYNSLQNGDRLVLSYLATPVLAMSLAKNWVHVDSNKLTGYERLY
jgi:hypothetical protein